MAIDFRCTQCGKLLRTGDDTAGKQAKCPACGTVMTIPTPGVALLSPTPGSPFAGGLTESDNPYQSPVAFMPPSQAAPREPITPTALDVGDVFSRTWAIFKPNWGMSLAVVVVVWLISFGANMLSGLIPIAGPILAGLLGFWLAIGQAIFFLKTARGQDAALGDIFTGSPYFLKLLLAQLCLGLIVFGIAVVCVLPLVVLGLIIAEDAAVAFAAAGGLIAVPIIVYVQLSLSQFYYLILDRDAGVFDSFKMSQELTRGNKLTLFGIGLLCFALTVLAVLPCGLGMLVAWPYFALMWSVIYLAITGQPTGGTARGGVEILRNPPGKIDA